MNTEELFIDGNKLPKALSKHEIYKLLELIQNGDSNAREKLVEHNIRLVLYEVTGKFKNVNYDKKDLVSIGIIGLMKAINTFDTTKKVEFATYAVRCIDNEILMFIRKIKKHQNVESLDNSVYQGSDGSDIKLEDMLSDDTNVEEDYTDNETYQIIRMIVDKLPEREQLIIKLHFGFVDDKTYTQKEIADKLQISQSYVSRLVAKIVKKVGILLNEKGVVELRDTKKSKELEIKEGSIEMPKGLQTIYDYFNDYSREQVDVMLEKLNEDEKKLIMMRYGTDLDNPITSEYWNKEHVNKFYGSLIPKMKRLLSNPNGERKPRQQRIEAKIVSNEEKIATTSKEEIKTHSDDNIKIIELLRDETFFDLMKTYEVKEAIIIALKLGYVDGKSFSTESVAQFFGMDINEVIEITRKALMTYKMKLNQMMDETINLMLNSEFDDEQRGI